MDRILSLSDRDQLRRLRAEIEQALAPIGERLGVALKQGTMSYDPDGSRATLKIEATVEGAESKIAKEWREFAKFHSDTFTGREVEERETFQVGVCDYRIIGLKRRAPKRPVCAESVKDGRRYVFEVPVVVAALAVAREKRKAS